MIVTDNKNGLFLLVHNFFPYPPQNLRLSNKERCFKVLDNMIIDNNLFPESRAVKNTIHQFQQTAFRRRANFRRKISFPRILYFPTRSRIRIYSHHIKSQVCWISMFSYWNQVPSLQVSIFSYWNQVPSLLDKYILIRPKFQVCKTSIFSSDPCPTIVFPRHWLTDLRCFDSGCWRYLWLCWGQDWGKKYDYLSTGSRITDYSRINVFYKRWQRTDQE